MRIMHTAVSRAKAYVQAGTVGAAPGCLVVWASGNDRYQKTSRIGHLLGDENVVTGSLNKHCTVTVKID